MRQKKHAEKHKHYKCWERKAKAVFNGKQAQIKRIQKVDNQEKLKELTEQCRKKKLKELTEQCRKKGLIL